MKTIEKEIVIIGAGLTGLTLAFYLKKAGKSVMLVEQNDRTGGVINSVTENGFTYETGPSTGVISSIEMAELFEDLQGKCTLETANTQAKKRYIWKNKKWEALPSGLISAVKTPLFTLSDKFRILGEPFRKAGGFPDESIAGLVKRRLGKSFLDYAVDPFISGVYAGDPEQLITRFALPKLYALEKNYGGFIRGSIKKQGEPKEPNSHKKTGDVFSVAGGLKSLTLALNNEIGIENIRTNCQQTTIAIKEKTFTVTFVNSSGETMEMNANKVITTVGGYALPGLLPFVDEKIMNPLAQMTYAPVIQAAVGYKKWDGIKVDAFGALVPSKEKRNILGILFPSAIFKGRVPEGGALFSVFLGGIKKPELLCKTDDELAQIIGDEIHKTMGTKANPDLLRIHRHRYAIAQYDVTTGLRYDSIDWIQNKYPGLILAGNIRDGIGMSDRVKQARKLADKLITEN